MHTTRILLLISAATLTQASGGPKQKLFIDMASGYKFIYPATWSLKETKVKSVFTIPIGAERKGATLEIMDLKFNGDRLVWQELQATAARDSGRNLEQQWEEDILNVPLLLTKTSRVGTPSTLVGLLYARQDRKFWFKLSAKPEFYEEAVKIWREALLTLTPASGELPKAEEADRPSTEDPKKKPPKRTTSTLPLDQDPDKPRPLTVIKPDNAPGTPKPARGTSLFESTAGGRKVQVILPSSAEVKAEGSVLTLTLPGLQGTLTLEPLSVLDSGPADQRLVVASGETLSMFTKVLLREEPQPWRNASGARVATITRRGETANGLRVETVATGESIDFYWLLRYVATSEEMVKADRGPLSQVLEKAAVRAIP